MKGENVWIQLIVLAMRSSRSSSWGWVSLEHPAASRIWDIPQLRELSRGPCWPHASLQLGTTHSYVAGVGCTFICAASLFTFSSFVSPTEAYRNNNDEPVW